MCPRDLCRNSAEDKQLLWGAFSNSRLGKFPMYLPLAMSWFDRLISKGFLKKSTEKFFSTRHHTERRFATKSGIKRTWFKQSLPVWVFNLTDPTPRIWSEALPELVWTLPSSLSSKEWKSSWSETMCADDPESRMKWDEDVDTDERKVLTVDSDFSFLIPGPWDPPWFWNWRGRFSGNNFQQFAWVWLGAAVLCAPFLHLVSSVSVKTVRRAIGLERVPLPLDFMLWSLL